MGTDDARDADKQALGRRSFLAITGGSAVLTALPLGAGGCSRTSAPAPVAVRPVDASRVRVASVPTAVEGNLLPALLADYGKLAERHVDLVSSTDPYALARSGAVDLAISHYGHREAEAFVMDGYGEWPRTLFSNQMALLGPARDPAGIRGLQDAGEAFRRIAETRSPFVVNDIDGVRYLTDILWNAAGRPERSEWLIDAGQKKGDAVLLAASRGAYTLWGLTPFLRVSDQVAGRLEPLVLGDPLLQRMLVSVVVKPGKAPGANDVGATALQAYLLAPSTQARIRDIHYPGGGEVAWVPAGRHNRTGMLPKS